MKHQYFGDINDLFKYDLLKYSCKYLGLEGIVFIPLHTGNDNTTEGSNRNYAKSSAGKYNIELIDFLKQYIDPEKRDTREIQKYFNAKGIPFNYLSDETFSHKERSKYFSSINEKRYEKQILFFDPDNGLEIKKSSEKHILFSEIENCLKSQSYDSICCVIQFRYRYNTWEKVLISKSDELEKFSNKIFIYNHSIGFFYFTNNSTTLNKLSEMLDNYKILNEGLMIKKY